MNIQKAIQSLIGSLTTSVWAGFAPEKTAIPYIVHRKVDTIPSPNADGKSTLDAVRYQVSVYHSSYADCEILAELVRSTIDEVVGTVENVNIESIRFESDNYIYEGEGIHHIPQDYIIRIKR